MKHFYLIFVLFLCYNYRSENLSNNHPEPEDIDNFLYSGSDHDTCLNKKFSIVFYVMQDSANNLNMNNINNVYIPKIMKALNDAFVRICVTFENCSTVVIPNYEYNNWYFSVDSVVTSNWYTEKTINIYLVEKALAMPDYEYIGYAHSAYNVPGTVQSGKHVMVFELGPLAFPFYTPGVPGTIEHVAGHFFGLPDTFSDIGPPASPGPSQSNMSSEFVRRTNCAVNGDGFCDTDADPFPNNSNAGIPSYNYCGYGADKKDGKNDYYTPPVDNFMSMYDCRCRFTQEQYNYMARHILTKLWFLH